MNERMYVRAYLHGFLSKQKTWLLFLEKNCKHVKKFPKYGKFA